MKQAGNADGMRAEQLAAQFLAGRGLTLVERNYRCRYGEIDLILRDGPVLVFAEVRLRRRSDYGGAAQSITAAKRQRILGAARHYLMDRKPTPCRFDALLLDALAIERITWIKDVFTE